MFNRFEKTILAICGICIIGSLAVISYCHAEIRYYDGRIDAGKDLLKELERIKSEIMETTKVEAE